eukprot:c32879_g1_i1 orf=3-158(-)
MLRRQMACFVGCYCHALESFHGHAVMAKSQGSRQAIHDCLLHRRPFSTFLSC